MTRQRKIDRPKRVEIYLPGSILEKARQELYSELEGRVPFGAMSALGTELFIEWLKSRGHNI